MKNALMNKALVNWRMTISEPHESNYRIPSGMRNDSHASNILNLWGTTYRITNEADAAYFNDQNEIIFDIFLKLKSWDLNIV